MRLRWYDRGPMPYIIVTAGAVGVIGGFIALAALYGHLAYHDWMCAFKHCVEVR